MNKYRTRCLIAVAFAASFLVGLAAQEIVTLTTPIVKPSTSTCRLEELHIDPDLAVFANSRIVVVMACNNAADSFTKQYDQFTTPTGAALITTLNRSNNAVGNPSLIAKVYNRLVADGVLIGTVSGAVQ
jgi:hypothetical protein